MDETRDENERNPSATDAPATAAGGGEPALHFRSDRDMAIHAPDLDKAKTFYHGVMGFPVVEQSESHLAFDTGHFTLWVNLDDEPRSFVPAFAVSSYERAKQALVEAGCEILRDSPKGRNLYFSDPFGFVADIIEKP